MLFNMEMLSYLDTSARIVGEKMKKNRCFREN